MLYNKLKAKDREIVDIFLGVISERDGKISETISNMDNGIKQAFNQIGFALNVLKEAVVEAGVSTNRLDEIAQTLAGGLQNVEGTVENGGTECSSSPGENPVAAEERGDEHFGR